MPVPRPLPENADHVFAGESAWPPAVVAPDQAQALAAAVNPTGRPNRDVLRGFLGHGEGRGRERWQIDFPAHYTEQEAALHQQPFALLRQRVGAGTLVPQWWVNPQAQPPLRTALARVQRFLALPADLSEPGWQWIEGDWLPDESLVVVARDDDFTAAVLQSAFFAEWWLAHQDDSSALRIAASFPFPWPLGRPLGALTGPQQDLRLEAARAARAGDSAAADAAVARAYDWPEDLSATALLTRLNELHHRRLAGSRSPFPLGGSHPPF